MLRFEWEETPDNWQVKAELIEGLYDAGLRGESGHQYLTSEGQGNIIVELSLNE
jgi:cell division protein FtsI/penicillin-binding protein 2